MAGAWQEFELRQRRRPFVGVLSVAGIAVVVFAMMRYFAPADVGEPATSSLGIEASVVETPALESVVEPEVTPSTTAVAQGSGGSATVGVYECWDRGQRILADHPCGADAQVRVIEVDRPDPVEVARQRQRAMAAQQHSGRTAASGIPVGNTSSGAGANRVDNESACRAVDAEIRAINAQMREGYTSQQGEWLRARWHAAQKRRAALDCGS